MAAGVAVAFATILLAVAFAGLLGNQHTRVLQRTPLRAEQKAHKTYNFTVINDSVGDQPWVRYLISGVQPGAPAPPGVPHLPRPGTYFSSPAFDATQEGTQRLFGSRVGTISTEGLTSPRELVTWEGVTSRQNIGASRGMGFGASTDLYGTTVAPPTVGLQLLVLLIIPAMSMILVASRLSTTTRERRLAALRLVGMDRGELTRLAGWESAAVTVAGAIIGSIVFTVVIRALGSTSLFGLSWFADELGVAFIPQLLLLGLFVCFSVFLGGRSVRRAMSGTLDARVSVERHPRPALPFAVFMVGSAGLTTLFLLSRQHRATSSTWAALALVGFAGAATAGALGLIAPGCAHLASRRANHAKDASSLLGWRWLEHSPASTMRFVAALMALVITGGISAAVLTDGLAASGATRSAEGAGYAIITAPANLVARLVTTAGKPALISQTMTTDSGAQGSLLMGTCEALSSVLGVASVPNCLDGVGYRLTEGVTSSEQRSKTFSISGGAQRLPYPQRDLATPNLMSSTLSDNSVFLSTSKVTSAPELSGHVETTAYFVLPDGASSLAHLQVAAAQVSPSLSVEWPSRDLPRIVMYRSEGALLRLGIVGAVILCLVSMAIATIDGAIERRRPINAALVMGLSLSELRRALLVMAAVPLLAGVSLAAAVAFLAGNVYLRLGGVATGLTLDGLYTAIVVGLLGVLAALASTLLSGSAEVDSTLLRND